MPRRIERAAGLAAEERRTLEAWVARPPSGGLARRASIVLACERARSDAEVARALGVSLRTVRSWRERFQASGLAGLFDAPRPGAGRRVGEERLALLRRLGPEDDAGHGPSTRAAAAAAGVSQSTVSRAWRELGLAAAPRRSAAALDLPPFAGRQSQLAGVLVAGPDRMAAFLVPNPARGGGPAAGGTLPREIVDRLAAMAERAAPLSPPRRALEAWRFLDALDARAPAGGALHLLLADRRTLRLPSVRPWIGPGPRLRFHLPLAGESWIEALERWIPWLLGTARAIPAARELRERLAEALAGGRAPEVPFVWLPGLAPRR